MAATTTGTNITRQESFPMAREASIPRIDASTVGTNEIHAQSVEEPRKLGRFDFSSGLSLSSSFSGRLGAELLILV